jgi:hypothetical protein
MFGLYFGLGREHILDLQGYDHILFVVALCAVYLLREWKQILILVTAFTVGHSVTLALATLNLVTVNSAWVEFFIPLTIFTTAVFNIFRVEKSGGNNTRGLQLNYVFALFFGLIHGLGFSNFLRSLLGQEQSLFTPLLAFNLGLELGQLLIVVIFLLFSFVVVDVLGANRRDWKLVISSGIAGIALVLMQQRIPF